VAAFILERMEEWRARPASTRLEEMSDHELRDIGLRRTDVVFGRHWRPQSPLEAAEPGGFERTSR
jgi:uncharacterized protein YjiS (DUF1127 family)